ncbi:glycosyltransferase family 4 protein [Okibacterium fritillariae]|uniref:D-inositol 3-phosphate glycosyltransferase n=1 Tax=Okibacterium fritillariae TaxID=123320 RepID=A0A1T5KAL3_9MICO|nr:glycosyltransferase family 4 protein [Okibacterium fritillariae]SKC60762.1 Glycosyltransferase involved in cell wall bisynthesis [Okibacterium fritillariae]
MERVYEDVAERLIGDGFDVALLTTGGFEGDELKIPYKRVWTVQGGRPGRYSRTWWKQTRRADAPWLTWAPDVVLSVSIAGRRLSRAMPSLPILAQCHGTAWAEVRSSLATPSPRELAKVVLNLARIPREAMSYRQFTRIVAIGPGVEKQLIDFPLRIAKSKVVKIANGIDVEAFEYSAVAAAKFRNQHGIPAVARVGLFASRLHVQKGADVALDAFARISEGPLPFLLICGTGPAEEDLRRQARRLGVMNRVIFTGALDRKGMSAAMSAADVLVFPTRRREGLPLTILEARANGLPVVTVQNAGVPADLTRNVAMTSGTAEDIAMAWSRSPERQHRNALPVEYQALTALRKYSALVGSIALGEALDDVH